MKPDVPERAGEVRVTAPAVVAAKPKAKQPTVVETATPRAEMKTINLELPAYVWTELKIRAAQRQTSLKHVVMTALQKDGITIADVDMIEDGRRVRGGQAAASPHS